MKNRNILYILSAFFISTSLNICAESFKILSLNSKKIFIGKKQAKPGLIFTDKDIIKWNNNNEKMNVRDLSTHKSFSIYPSQFEKDQPSNIHQLIVNKKLSTRGFGNNVDLLEIPLIMLDTVYLPTGNQYNRPTYDYIALKNDDNLIGPLEKCDNGNFIVLPRKIFENFDNEEIIFSIIENDGENTYILYEDLIMQFIPIN